MRKSLQIFTVKFLLIALFLTPCLITKAQKKQRVAELVEKAGRSLDSNKFSQAIDYSNQALKLDPKNVFAYDIRGYSQGRLGKTEEALQDLNKAIGLNAFNPLFFLDRGQTYYNSKNLVKAVADYSEAIRLNPKFVPAYNLRAEAYLDNGFYDRAISDCSECIAIDKMYAGCYQLRGAVYMVTPDYNKAIADFTQAIEINPMNLLAYSWRGGANLMLGNYTKAIEDLERAIVINPDYPYAYYDLITTYTHTGEFEKAKQCFRTFTVRKLHAEQSEGWEFYAHYMASLTEGVFVKDYRKALSELAIAEELYAGSMVSSYKKTEAKLAFVDVLFIKGYVLEQTGHYAEAKTAYEQALSLNKNWTDISTAIQGLKKKATTAITEDKTPPDITLIEPQINRSFDIIADEKQQVIGRANDISGIKSVTINGEKIYNLQANGTFIYDMPFTDGKNILNITATDKKGNKTSKLFSIAAKKSIGRNSTAENSRPVIPENTYHAILIAEQSYNDPSIQSLKHPIEDARELKTILETYYTFNTENIKLLEDKSREDIIETVTAKCNALKENDNLLIFYAGHGIANKDKYNNLFPYWIPVSAKKDQVSTYISFNDIKIAIQSSGARHILIIADACFSGGITRGLSPDAPLGITNLYSLASRKAMTSGNLEAVPDVSVFAANLKDNLKGNKQKYLPADDLFQSFKKIVQNYGTVPQHSAIPDTDDNGGDFIFIKK